MFNMSTVAPRLNKDKFCKKLFNSLAKGYADTLYAAYIYQRKNASSAKFFYGDKYCGAGTSCIRNMTFSVVGQ